MPISSRMRIAAVVDALDASGVERLDRAIAVLFMVAGLIVFSL